MNNNYNNLTPEQKRRYDELKCKTDYLKGKTEDQLLAELQRLNAGGDITPQKLRDFKKNVGPLLNEQQLKKLDEIIAKLNKS